MLNFLPLAIFPEGCLASSVITTVWIGIAVVVFFNQRFGWVLSGLVIPGYLVPMLLEKPVSAVVVIGEGILTYMLVWFYSEYLSEKLGWSNLFGRDRFFALVLSNALIRVLADGLLLPMLGEWMVNSLQLQFDYRNNLHSFGLIIGALIANNFWKTGLRTGFLQLATTTGITLLIVRYVLMTTTNFNINSLSYVYEDIASSILASPKSYILLICTAFLASRMNLLYGWDFAGILIPSLLALEWYQPEKIVSTFVETGAILAVAVLVLKLPVFRGATIEGGRKLLLFFNISYAYKFALGYAAIWLFPAQKITDLYGFGYLLPTLIAIKMHDKEIHAKMTRAILQTSLFAALGATAVGFALAQIPGAWNANPVAQGETAGTHVIRDETLAGALRKELIALYRPSAKTPIAPSAAGEISSFRQAALSIGEFKKTGDAKQLASASARLESLGYQVHIVEERFLLLREKEPRRYWGTYVINLDSKSGLAIEVPAPLDERGTAESGLWLMRKLNAGTLAMAGRRWRTQSDGSDDVLRARNTAYHVFHEVFGSSGALQVRAFAEEATHQDANTGKADMVSGVAGSTPLASTLWVKGKLPEEISLGMLKELIGSFEIRWGERSSRNLQRETTQSGFVELQLRDKEAVRLLSAGQGNEGRLVAIEGEHGMDGYLQSWLLQDKSRIAPPGSNRYRKPAAEELFFMDKEVVTPLLKAAHEHYRNREWSSDGLAELGNIHVNASAVGYELRRYRHRSSGKDYLILAEPDSLSPDKRRYWGTYVFRLGNSSPFIVQVPRPVYDVNGFEFAVSLFESTNAGALLIGGSSPDANADRSADIVKPANKENVFITINQALLRYAGNEPRLILQARAVGTRPDMPLPASDVLVSISTGVMSAQQLSAHGHQLMQALDRFGLSVGFAKGDMTDAGYDVAALAPTMYLNASRNKEFAALWLSPVARGRFLQQTQPTPQTEQLMALKLKTVEEDIHAYVARHGNRLSALPAPFRSDLLPYFSTSDIVVLHAAMARHPQLHFERLVDLNSRQGFLAIKDAGGNLLALMNLNARSGDKVTPFSPDARRASIQTFVDARHGWLLSEEAQ